MTADLLSREWPLAPCWAHLLMSQLMCKSFSWPCLWEYSFWELCAQMRLRRSYPAMAVDSCWLLFISVTVMVNFVSIWLDRKVPRCLVNISGCPWIYFWVRITFEWVDWVKEISLLLRTCTSHAVEDLDKRKRGRKREFIHPVWSLVLEFWYLPT